MPKARMIATDIGQDERVAQLPYEPHDAQKFFTWMIGKGDKEGRLSGDPKLLAKIVAPYCDYTADEVEEWLSLMESLKKNGYGLIERYEVNGQKYIWLPGWDKNQPPSYRGKESPSKIPSPPENKKAKPQKKASKNSTDDILDPRLAKIVKAYEDFRGSAIGPTDFELLKDACDEYPEGWFEKGIEEAKKYNKRSLKYIMAILQRWKEEESGAHQGTTAQSRKTFDPDKPLR